MKRPWMPLYVADYQADTQHLTATEHGAYLLLLMFAWGHGGTLPVEDDQLCRIARVHPPHWPRVRKALEPFFGNPKTGGSWCSKRLSVEITKAAEISNKRKAAAQQKHSNSPANGEQLHTHARTSHNHSNKERKEDIPANAGSSKYVFEDGIIRLNQRDFDSWTKAYTNLDLRAELLSLSKWAETEGKNWFHAVKGALSKRNREVKIRTDAIKSQGGFQWNGGIEGVI